MNPKRFFAVFALAAAAIPAAQAHGKLTSSEPKAASVLDKSPSQVRLQFDEALEPAFSKIRLVDASNAEVTLPKTELDKSNPMAMAVALPPLHAGQYRVQWSAVTHDGHKAKGEYAFRVK